MSRHRTPNTFTLRSAAIVAAISAGSVLTLGLLASVGTSMQHDRAGTQHQSLAAIEEDQPGWNCTSHGNLTCGPNVFTFDLGSSVVTFAV